MKIVIHKKKILQIMSNGSLNNFYKTSNNLTSSYNFFEKDFVNSFFNLKDKNISINNDKTSDKYKNKYVN